MSSPVMPNSAVAQPARRTSDLIDNGFVDNELQRKKQLKFIEGKNNRDAHCGWIVSGDLSETGLERSLRIRWKGGDGGRFFVDPTNTAHLF